MKKLASLFKGIDIYGHPIGVNYKGDGTFNTVMGSFITLITAFIVLSYASLKMMDIHSRDSQNELTHKIKINPEAVYTFCLHEDDSFFWRSRFLKAVAFFSPIEVSLLCLPNR